MNERPNPDELLSRLRAEDEHTQRAKLKIFFGASAGVGKTFAMLVEAHERRRSGVDVVVGLAETHGRRETAALLDGLELLPRRSIPYRGATIEEFDLDAALARRPELIVLDELAHTNAPGSRHRKRWQDVEELLGVGIRRIHDAQRPARREPVRRRRRDHRHPAERNGSGRDPRSCR